MSTLVKQFKNVRRVSAPLVVIKTPDPPATITLLQDSYNGGAPALVRWDCLLGARPLNERGQPDAAAIMPDPNTPVADTLGRLTETMLKLEQLSVADTSNEEGLRRGGAILFIVNAQRFLGLDLFVQGLCNVRDAFKSTKRMVVLLGPDLRLPPELENDFVVLDEPRPDAVQLGAVITRQYRNVGLQEPSGPELQRSVEALLGIPAFPAEQAAAMSLTRTGMNNDGLWDRKAQQVESSGVLSFYRGTETLDAMGGCRAAKSFGVDFFNGEQPPAVIIYIDEIEKDMEGSTGRGGGDAGASAYQLKLFLTEMQDRPNYTGIIAVGPPGTGKSTFGKALGNSVGRRIIQMDVGAGKGSHVGETEERTREAFKVIYAVSQGHALFYATCNNAAILPPELKRRFRLATFFFDLLDAEEREAIWQIWLAKFGLDPAQRRPADQGWTGAEIRQCCENAWRLRRTLEQAGGTIVPVAVSDADRIERLRRQASGRYLSASYPGPFRYDSPQSLPQTAVVKASSERLIQLED